MKPQKYWYKVRNSYDELVYSGESWDEAKTIVDICSVFGLCILSVRPIWQSPVVGCAY